MSIAKFYENQEIFITGGSGFIGKALIEKLLRSCPGVSKIFVLMRSKRNKNIDDRLSNILNEGLFKRLHVEQPDALRKVVAIEGDCSELNLGISNENLEKMKNVSLIFHAAASVRFDDDLRNAILLNTRGTHELIKIAKNLKKLKAFVHVSTAYCYTNKKPLEEKVEAGDVDWRKTIKLAETYDVDILNILNLKYSNFYPNTYTFTKNLAEQVVNDHKEELPMLIYRPSIVLPTVSDPFPGWVDNYNGPAGLTMAGGLGICHVFYCNPDVVQDYVPIDVVIRSMLVACFKVCTQSKELQRNNELEVFNTSVIDITSITTREYSATGYKVIEKSPFERTLWYTYGITTTSFILFYTHFLTFSLPLGMIYDSLLRLFNRKPMVMTLLRRLYSAFTMVEPFSQHVWTFRHDNFLALENIIPSTERVTFGFLDIAKFDYEELIDVTLRFIKEFMLKEPPQSTSGAIRRYRILKVTHYITMYGFISFSAYYIIKSLLQFICNFSVTN